jgi:uncharacterized RDD family membrane protein YckC
LIDYALQLLFFFGWISTFGEVTLTAGGGYAYNLEGPLAWVPLLFWVAMVPGMKQWLGATLGNLLLGLKPVSIRQRRSGVGLTLGQSIKRHLLDPIDLFFLGVVAIISMGCTKEQQRLGDLWAGTKVVIEQETMISEWYGQYF